ncbi:MAG: peptidoglycan bridge formation glycyltransferase FemA/FemB family protein [Candidatus Doudnabacteria bacterium]|nr:peptidoglycan bridge formation glycyltransferase FemA/FemB family protein [Candidatus Doudnabacteria bacterium]
MNLIELSSADKDSYNRFVAESPSGSFLQSWEWGQWQESLGRQIKRFALKTESGEWTETIQLLKMPIFGKKYYWYAPYGPVPASGQRQADSGQFFELLRRELPQAVFIRAEPKGDISLIINPLSLTKSTNIQPAKTLIIDLSKNAEQLMAEMHHKTRYNIKLAQKHGCQIKDEFAVSVGHGLFFDEALKLILQTSERQQFSTFSARYYQKLVDFFALKNQGEVKLHIYKAVFQNQLLAAAIMVDFGNTRTFLFGGSSAEHKNIMAPYLMHWQAMLDAKASGFSEYDFWGIETSSGNIPGFVRFKLGFGGQPLQYSGAYDLVCDSLWYKLYGFGRKLNRLIKKASA